MNLDSLKVLAAALPESHKANAEILLARMGETIEGIGDEPATWRAPLLKLLQPTSDRSKLPKGSGAGDLFINETKQDQPLGVIVLRLWNGRQFWSPDQNEAKMLCSSPDAKLGYIGLECAKCPHSQYNEDTKKSECNKIKQVLVIKADFSDVFMVNFAKTNYAVGNEWETLLKKAGVAPYRRIYDLRSETNKKYKTIETYVVEPRAGNDKVVADVLVPFLTELFNLIGTDRKDSLDKFYEIVKARREDPQLLTDNSGSDSQILLEDTSTKDDSGSSSLASKYSV
jgi:hypothetical protein